MLGAGDFVKVLVVDTCEEVGTVALCDGELAVAEATLAARGSSSGLVPAIAQLLEKQGWSLADLDGVGVVSGPGSFTGVRVGLAAAKGLCEVASLPLVAVSRLEVLAAAAGLQDGCAVLNAGRGEVYVRVAATGNERLCGLGEVRAIAAGGLMVVAEDRMLAAFAGEQVALLGIHAAQALPIVLRELSIGAGDAALVDANYVRGERDIYGKSRAVFPGESI